MIAFVSKLTDSAEGKPPLRFENTTNAGNGSPGVNVILEAAGGDVRIAGIADGGGHWEIHTFSHIPANQGIELDENGFPLVHQG
jgi:hypothetical protein